jgi:hypothetical protein
VSKGAKEASGLSRAETEKRIRRPGGGRKSYQESWVDIDEKFLQVLCDHTAGDPMDETVRWTNLSVKEMVQLLRDEHEINVSKSVVRKLLKKHDYRRRKAQKKPTMNMILRAFLKASSFRTASMIYDSISAIFSWEPAVIPVNLPVTVSATGGITMDVFTTPMRHRS